MKILTNLLLTALLLLLPVSAWASVVCSDAVESSSAAPSDPYTVSGYTTPSGSNQVLFAFVAARHTTSTINSATHAGNTMTAIAAQTFLSPVMTRMFYIVNPTSGTNDVVVDFSAAVLTAAVVVFTCSGVDISSPVHDHKGATGTGTAVTITVDNVGNNDVVVDMFSTDIASSDPTEGADQTVLHKGNAAGELGWGASQQPGTANDIMSWDTALSQEWAIQAVAISPALPMGGLRRRGF